MPREFLRGIRHASVNHSNGASYRIAQWSGIRSSPSDTELLARIAGPRVARRIYQGKLAPLFATDKGPKGREKLLPARELIWQMLAEEMRRQCVLSSPNAVRDYLRLLLSREGAREFCDHLSRLM